MAQLNNWIYSGNAASVTKYFTLCWEYHRLLESKFLQMAEKLVSLLSSFQMWKTLSNISFNRTLPLLYLSTHEAHSPLIFLQRYFLFSYYDYNMQCVPPGFFNPGVEWHLSCFVLLCILSLFFLCLVWFGFCSLHLTEWVNPFLGSQQQPIYWCISWTQSAIHTRIKTVSFRNMLFLSYFTYPHGNAVWFFPSRT